MVRKYFEYLVMEMDMEKRILRVFRERVLNLIDDANLTYEKLAEKTDLSVQTIKSYLGKKKFNPK